MTTINTTASLPVAYRPASPCYSPTDDECKSMRAMNGTIVRSLAYSQFKTHIAWQEGRAAEVEGEDADAARCPVIGGDSLAAAVLTLGHQFGLQLVTATRPWSGWSFHAFDVVPCAGAAGEAIHARALEVSGIAIEAHERAFLSAEEDGAKPSECLAVAREEAEAVYHAHAGRYFNGATIATTETT